MPELESAIADGEAANDDVVGTREMRAELEKDGVVLPDEDDMTTSSLKLNEWLEEYRYKEGRAPSHSWFNLFAEVDASALGDARVIHEARVQQVQGRMAC